MHLPVPPCPPGRRPTAGPGLREEDARQREGTAQSGSGARRRAVGHPPGSRAPDRHGARDHRAADAQARHVRPASRHHAVKPAPPRLHLYSRHHIDLLRVAGALCRP
ncbi:putative leader peptide [Streptomyces sp. NPDC059740]|uniref:putative leader peptide n=1 Tax=Streptomyces sp. NPDC059740 TaxID=3346926 RepID=UPI00366745EB